MGASGCIKILSDHLIRRGCHSNLVGTRANESNQMFAACGVALLLRLSVSQASVDSWQLKSRAYEI